MDPTACLKRILESMEVDPDWDEVLHATEDLESWLEKGEFVPELDQETTRVLLWNFCRIANELARDRL